MEAESGYVAVDGTDMYWESRGSGGPPLLLVHGGYGLASDFGELADRWRRPAGHRGRTGRARPHPAVKPAVPVGDLR